MKIYSKTILVMAVSVGMCLGASAIPSFAQSTPDSGATRTRGTVEKLDGKKLLITAEGAGEISFTLAPDVLITTTKPSSLSDIKAGDFVASAAMMGDDGKLHSTELRIFPNALRGAGEGQRPMNAPKTVMTNATVSEVIAAPEGRILKVKFKQGTSELIVGPEVKITALVASDISVLKPGTSITVTAAKNADGSMTATRIGTN